ncbi:histidine--tRNA ligase [Buchnera aphidicola]|uniref:Histidine--tRNA ligase n=1 Tax=Buchnera aphidicola (Cinara cf. splendens/pseudotsugae 3390) TaxID=2518980 RepID=A0A451CWU6_9GAMM|nr:histidine--tRNA ligase [Buchnera aphidicola]VFP77767.1 Histidine--tRNA ligase [Buchnera aphidicola (Cinara cf. splendens/pseudotsugae 3390)]
MNKKYQSVRGMHDILPVETYFIQIIEKKIKKILNSYSYFEIRSPIIEYTELFEKSIGNNTDIIHKEMYNFKDKKKKKISLRPEGTISCIRACIQNNVFYNSKIQKLWYYGPMFRYERPQRGRFRQFQQFGVEYFGINNIFIDYDIIMLTVNIWKKLNLSKYLILEINSLGTVEDRKDFSLDLKKFFQKYISKLTTYEKKLLSTNPIRILDSKNTNIIKLLRFAPMLHHYISSHSYKRFKKLCSLLTQSKINYIINHRLVRGLDYYNDTVFEWTAKKLGSQNAVCAGGRYDNLVEYLGGIKNPAIGFAIGVDRVIMLTKLINPEYSENFVIDINIIFLESIYSVLSIYIANQLHFMWPKLKINTSLKKFRKNNYLKKLKKTKSKFLLILQSNLLNVNKILVKNMCKKKSQIIPINRIFQNPCIFIN